MAHEYGRIRILAIAKMLNEGERISISKILSRLESQYGIYADRKTIYTDLSAIGRFMPIDKKKGVNAGYKKCGADEPTVEVVRCKDCKHWECWRTSGEGSGDCKLDDVCTLATQHYDFCSYGERRTDG